jgi:acylpyruvate hydrolase
MRFVTIRDRDGCSIPGLITSNGIVDLSAHGFTTMRMLVDVGLDHLGAITDIGAGPIVDGTLLAPIEPGAIIVTGTNYRSHIAEMGGSEPARPTANLTKLGDSVCGHRDAIEVPSSCKLDYEGEIAIVIGRYADHLRPDEALDAIFGLCLANDLSARDAPTTHLVTAKSGTGFCPLGPWITTLDELNLEDLSFEVSVNGELRQRGHVDDLIHSIVDIVVSFSASLPLWPGDVILTGSPSGVGVALDPPCFLQPGDVVDVTSNQLGKLTSTFVAPATVNSDRDA